MRTQKTYFQTIVYLFKTFLLVGASSFGGYSALVAVVQRLMVERDKAIENDAIIEGFSIASLLPGPVAVNTVTYIGYSLGGWLGAMVSMVAVLLPSMLLMIVLAFFYERYNYIVEINAFLSGVIPVVMAIIFAAAYKMAKKGFNSYKHVLILVIILALQILFKGYWVFIIGFALGGVSGLFLFKNKNAMLTNQPKVKYTIVHLIVSILLVVALGLNFIKLPTHNINVALATVFSGVSLTLFGGGYVMIPMLNNIIVLQKAWLSNTEFMNAIALGQITPGPILISATFIGYKLNGLWGAIIATVSIFFPSGLLMVLVSDTFKRFNQNRVWKSIFEGLKPVVVALILSSVVILGKSIENWWISGVIFLLSSILLIRYKINFLWLMIAAGIIGFFYS